MKKIIILCCSIFTLLKISAQDTDLFKYEPVTFEVIKYDGTIGKYPITMLLTFFPDKKISGFYYYKSEGKLLKMTKLNNKKSNVFKAVPLGVPTDYDNVDCETFTFPGNLFLNKSKIEAQWVYGKKKLPVVLKKDTNMLDWRLLRLTTQAYFTDDMFKTQITDYSFVFPSYLSSPILNKRILNDIDLMDENLFSYINSTKSKYIRIDKNYGENMQEANLHIWEECAGNEIAYVSDSIITFEISGYTFVHNGFSSELYYSVKTSTGEKLAIDNIFKINTIDTVLEILRKKYSSILEHKNDVPDSHSTSMAPYATDYTESTNIYISKSGIYFRERSFKLAPYYDLFVSYKEVEKFLRDNFKLLIGLN